MVVRTEGTVKSARSHVAKVEFLDLPKPQIQTVLTSAEDHTIKLLGIRWEDENTLLCMVLSGHKKIKRGLKVIDSQQSLCIPVGPGIIGRAIDVFGTSRDGLENPSRVLEKPVFGAGVRTNEASAVRGTLKTGIKAIDIFCPILKGGKTGLLGGAGVGKTMLLTEILHNIIGKEKKNTVSVFCGIGERSREGHELYRELSSAKVLESTSLIFGTMGDSPAVRYLTAHAGATIAEYFRDEMHKDVLVFIDNAYRYAQAGNELALLTEDVPSEDGYQSNLISQVANLHERLVSKDGSHVTTVEAIYLPSDDVMDQGVQAIYDFLDTSIVLTRDIYREGRLPAVDILASSSSALSPDIVGQEHYNIALDAQSMIEKSANLEKIVSLVGESELSDEDRLIYERSKKVKSYLTQDFFTSSDQTGREGVYVDTEIALEDIKGIVEGKFDDIPAYKFMYIGTMKDITK